MYILSFLQMLKKCLILLSPKHSLAVTIEGKVIDIKHAGELEIHTVHRATSNVWPGLLLIVLLLIVLLLIALYLALIAKSLDIPGLRQH